MVAVFCKLSDPNLELQGFDENFLKHIDHFQDIGNYTPHSYLNLQRKIWHVNLKCFVLKTFKMLIIFQEVVKQGSLKTTPLVHPLLWTQKEG